MARFFHDGRTVTAYMARSGSGSRYENANVDYWEHQGEAARRLVRTEDDVQYADEEITK